MLGHESPQPPPLAVLFAYILLKYYYPNMAKLIRQWVMSCEQCIRESRVEDWLTQPALENPIEHITVQEDAMQIDLVPELPPFDGYENIVEAMDVFPDFY